MTQQITYPHMESGPYIYQNSILEHTNEIHYNINQLSSELKNTSMKQSHQIKFIKQLKSRDIKLRQRYFQKFCSYKKFQVLPNKVNPNVKNVSTFLKQKNLISDEKELQIKHEDVAFSNKIKKTQSFEKYDGKQKSLETPNIFNPETVAFSKQSTILNRDRKTKRLKVLQTNNIQQKVLQSNSQSKKQKNNRNNDYQILTKSTFNTYDNQGNIFQNLDFLTKHNSYHSLDKNQQNKHTIGFNSLVSSKFQQKLQLPSLVSNSGLKNVRNKAQQTISLAHEHHQNSNLRSNFYIEEISKTQKSSPFIQKTVKIAIDRLKPLRPQQIKLKFQQKVKQEQKNRAKQRAIQMFQKEQVQAQLKKKHLEFMPNIEPQFLT